MTWVCNVSKDAAKQIQRYSKDQQKQIYSALKEMESDPFTGDVGPIKSGKFQNCYRKRVGKYRVIFRVDTNKKIVAIVTVLRRSDTTYN